MKLTETETPALIILRQVLIKNLERMQEYAGENGVILRPHIKTHKMPKLAEMQQGDGACGIACAKVSEAEVFVSAGFNNIQIANLIIGEKRIERYFELSKKVMRLTCTVDSEMGIKSLAECFAANSSVAEVYIEVNTGLNRNGVENENDALALAKLIDSENGINLAGLLTHEGSVYGTDSIEEIKKIGIAASQKLINISYYLGENGVNVKEISVGSTPAAKFSPTVSGVTELRPGNYVFNDMIQVSLGVAEINQCALRVLACVIGVHSNRIVLDSGSKTLTNDTGAHGKDKAKGFGYIPATGDYISRLSEEHGVIENPAGDYKIGDIVEIIPNHACNTCNMHEKAYLVEKGLIVDEYKVTARGKIH